MVDLAEIERRIDERWQTLRDAEQAGRPLSELMRLYDAYLATLDEWALCKRALDAEADGAQVRA